MNDVEIFAIDPGNTKSAYVVMRVERVQGDKLAFDPKKATILKFGKVENDEVVKVLYEFVYDETELEQFVVIERVASMGMAVGREVFETCEWIGRFTECACGIPVKYVYRLEEKITLCNSAKDQDANIRQALIDTYAKFDFKNGRGTKATPDTLYGFHADVWSALAVATTFMLQESGLGHYASWRKK